MALPRPQDTYEDYTDQLVYFSARLAANPLVAALAPPVDALVEQLDAEHEALRAAQRAEVRARARRDHEDDGSDEGLKKLRRRLKVVSSDHFAIGRLFPKGVKHVVAPRGRAQLERIDALVTAIDDVLASPQLAADPDAAELRQILETGKAAVLDAVTTLRPTVEAWEAAQLAVGRARDAFNFRRTEGVDRTGAVLGELRALLGGSARAAQAYTQPRTSTSGASSSGASSDDGEVDPEPEPGAREHDVAEA